MQNIFGIPMTSIMVALLILFGLSIGVGGWIFLRQRIIFRMGIRNVPRRPSQTILIVIGLMLSTLIVSAALTTGDTLDHSIKSTVLDMTQKTDELVVRSTGAGEKSNNAGPQPGVTFPQTVATDLQNKMADNGDISGISPALFESVPGINPRTKLSEPALTAIGADPATVEPLGGITSVDGDKIDLAALAPDSIVLGKTPADKMDAQVGDTLTIYVANQPHQMKVAAIANDWLLTGMVDPGSSGGFVMPLDRAQTLFNVPGQISFIAVSNTDGVGASDTVDKALDSAFEGTPYTSVTITKSALDLAELAGNLFTSLFVALGMFSIAAGILLIFLIFVLLAAERKPEMGMARAVGLRRRQLTQMFLAEGIAYDLVSALVGAALGVGVALVIAGVMGSLIGDFFSIKPSFTWRSMIVAYTLGVVITFLTIAISSWRVSRLNIVQAIRDIPEPTKQRASRRWLIFGILGILLGALMMLGGANSKSAFLFSVGISLVPLGLAVMLRRFGLPARLLYSLASLLVLAYWLLPSSVTDRFTPELNGGFEMFFVSGIMMVSAATVLIVWNAEIVTSLVALLGRAFSRWLPAVKTAVAYPMASKGRTGMTIAMFSLIIFSLVMMSTINANFTQIFTGDQAAAGWSIQATQQPNNPIPDFKQALADNGVDTSKITAVGRLDRINAGQTGVRLAGTQEWKQFGIDGTTADFIENSDLPLQTRAVGYDSDKAVWDAIRNGEDVAVIDSTAIPANATFGSSDQFTLKDVAADAKTMQPTKVEITDPITGATHSVTIVGILDQKVTMFTGLFIPEKIFQDLFPRPTQIGYYVKTADGVDNKEFAKSIKAGLVNYGVQADSYKELISQGNAISQGFLRIIEGFMGLGLVVGIAALGVVSFRSVVERRQQIGMLRAIGYRTSMVSASFLIESTMITALGVFSGVILALILARNLMTSGDLGSDTGSVPFVVPWVSVVIFIVISLGAGLLMSYIPAKKASSVPIADALRYE